MAERFFFDLMDGPSIIRNEAGVLAINLDHAITEAHFVLQEMRADDELSNDARSWVMVIRDADGQALKTLPVVPSTPWAAMAL